MVGGGCLGKIGGGGVGVGAEETCGGFPTSGFDEFKVSLMSMDASLITTSSSSLSSTSPLSDGAESFCVDGGGTGAVIGDSLPTSLTSTARLLTAAVVSCSLLSPLGDAMPDFASSVSLISADGCVRGWMPDRFCSVVISPVGVEDLCKNTR